MAVDAGNHRGGPSFISVKTMHQGGNLVAYDVGVHISGADCIERDWRAHAFL